MRDPKRRQPDGRPQPRRTAQARPLALRPAGRAEGRALLVRARAPRRSAL